MSWHDKCQDFDSRVEASADDENFHDVTFVLLQEDAENSSGDEIGSNKHLLALISPVFYVQFYGPLAVDVKMPIEIVDGTAYGFKQMMDFISHPKSFQIQVADVEDVFDVLYFGHKYQIGPLVSYCRSFLGSFGSRPAKEGSVHGFRFYFDKEEALDILQWAHSNKNLETTFTAEYSLLVHACWKKICVHFKDIFPEGNVRHDRPLPDEKIMMEIFDRIDIFAKESFILSVALNYFIELIDQQMESMKENVNRKQHWDLRLGPRIARNKRLKMDETHLWSQKLKKITKVIDLKKVSPSKISDILDKVEDKMPASIIDDIMETFTAGENSKTSFQEKNRSETSGPFIDFDLFEPEEDHDNDGEDSDDTSSLTSSEREFGRLHTINVDGEATMKFTINRNAIFSGQFISWEDDELEAITFQNGSDYEEIVREKWPGGLKFFAKENTPITLAFKVLRHKKEIFMYEVNKSNFSYNSFHLNILEVNGKPVKSENKMCYSPLRTLRFQPV